MGASLLYHLTKEGWRDVTLIEKGELTSGSTWHAAALVPHFTASPMIARLTSYASSLYESLERETGQSAGWHGCGSLRLALDEDQVDYLKYTASVLRAINVECHLIGADAISRLNPLLNPDGVLLAAYTPNDGHTDPNGTTQALALGARQRGATITRRDRVINMNQRRTWEWELTTEHGTVIAEHVVNAAGFFAPQVAAMLGVQLPIVTLLHQYLVTDEVPNLGQLVGELPVTRDPHASCYYRQEQKSILVGPFEPDPPVWGLDGVDWGVENFLAAPDIERILPLLQSAAERVPVLEHIGIRRIINGPLSHTPDGLPLLGAAADLRNCWMATGTNLGIALGAGCGKNLAQLIVHGVSEDYVRPMDPRRYGKWAMARFIPDSQGQRCLCRGIPKSPLSRRDLPRGGARFAPALFMAASSSRAARLKRIQAGSSLNGSFPRVGRSGIVFGERLHFDPSSRNAEPYGTTWDCSISLRFRNMKCPAAMPVSSWTTCARTDCRDRSAQYPWCTC